MDAVLPESWYVRSASLQAITCTGNTGSDGQYRL